MQRSRITRDTKKFGIFREQFSCDSILSCRIELFEELRDLLDRALEEELPAEIKLDVKGEEAG